MTCNIPYGKIKDEGYDPLNNSHQEYQQKILLPETALRMRFNKMMAERLKTPFEQTVTEQV